MTTTQRWQLLALTVLIAALLWALSPVLTPFAFAALLAYLGDPLVDRLERTGRSRNTSGISASNSIAAKPRSWNSCSAA